MHYERIHLVPISVRFISVLEEQPQYLIVEILANNVWSKGVTKTSYDAAMS